MGGETCQDRVHVGAIRDECSEMPAIHGTDELNEGLRELRPWVRRRSKASPQTRQFGVLLYVANGPLSGFIVVAILLIKVLLTDDSQGISTLVWVPLLTTLSGSTGPAQCGLYGCELFSGELEH